MFKKFKREDYEYHPKLAIIRILSLILILYLFYFSYNYFFEENNNNLNLDETNLINYIKENSKGNLYSLDENTKIEGNATIVRFKDMNKTIYLKIENFKIINNFNQNNSNIGIYSSLTAYGKGMIPLKTSKLNSSILNIHFPKRINLAKHKYIIFWNNQSRKTLAYTELKI